MIDFRPLELKYKEEYEQHLMCGITRGCEYSFVNLFLWGRQTAAIVYGQFIAFAQFNRRSVYLYPAGCGDKRAAVQAVMEDAKQRGIPCRFTGLTQDDCAELEWMFPGKFRFHVDRDSFDYIYDINALADLKGKKLQRKRNHLNRFNQEHPDCVFEPISDDNIQQVEEMVNKWYALRQQEDPHADYQMENVALKKALRFRKELGFEGLVLKEGGQILAMTMGSFHNADTMDVHFEKELDRMDNAYGAINNAFAKYIREKYPHIRWLNREEDMGLEGLRKAKLSYYPDHMIEKSWAHFVEDGYDY